jgi:Glycine rich protein
VNHLRIGRISRRLTVCCVCVSFLTLSIGAGSAQAFVIKTFLFTGAEQTFTVPGGVTTLGVTAIGGYGGAATDSVGGAPADVVGSVTVTPGQTLYVEVGGVGQTIGEGGEGGFNGGGNGGGGGGGASDVRTLPRASGLSTDPRLIVAAGGGGGGGSGFLGTGSNGGNAEEAGVNAEMYSGGGAGTSSAGGAAAEGCGGNKGGDGTLGQGGAGGNAGVISGPGGGGGGGYYGGGGGAGACEVGSSGGGGGSSLTSGLVSIGFGEEPKIEFKYVPVPPTVEIAFPGSGATYTQDQVVNASYTCTPPEGTTVSTCEGPVANGAPIDTATPGSHSFLVEAEDADEATATEEVTYTVVAPPTIEIVTPANGASYTQGQSVSAIYSCAPAGGTGVKTCTGSVANGAALDTAALGSHVLTVKAEDLDTGKAEKTVSYTVVAPKSSLPVPNTTLGSHPKKKITTTKAKVKVKFAFSSDVAGATFKCKLDKGSFAPCTSPKTYKVKPGKHTFSVEAVGLGGTDSTPATFGFKVKKAK